MGEEFVFKENQGYSTLQWIERTFCFVLKDRNFLIEWVDWFVKKSNAPMVAVAVVVHHGCYCLYKNRKSIKYETRANLHGFRILFISNICNVHLYCRLCFVFAWLWHWITHRLTVFSFYFVGGGGGGNGCLLRTSTSQVHKVQHATILNVTIQLIQLLHIKYSSPACTHFIVCVSILFDVFQWLWH